MVFRASLHEVEAALWRTTEVLHERQHTLVPIGEFNLAAVSTKQ